MQRKEEMDIQNLFGSKKWVFLAGTMQFLLAICFSLQACDGAKTMQEGRITVMTKTNSLPNIQVPSIDSSAPVKTETATFSLG